MIYRFLGAQWLAVAFVGALSFGVSVLVARRLGSELFGVYSAALSAGAMVAILVDGGFGKLLQRERVLPTPALSIPPNSLPGMACAHAALMISVCLIAAMLFGPANWPISLAVLSLVGAMAVIQFGLAMLRGDGRLVRDAAWQVGGRVLTALSVVLFLCWGATEPWQMILAQSVGGWIFAIGVIAALQIRPVLFIPATVYRALLPLVLIDVVTVVYFKIDMILLPLLGVPDSQVGEYGVAYRLLEAALLFASPVGLILFRRFRLGATDAHRTVRQISQIWGLVTAFGLMLWLLIFWLSEWLIVGAYGSAYIGAAPLLVVLAGALVLMLGNSVLNQAVLALGLERALATAATFALIINIAGNLWLIPRYGVMASAWMTVLTEVVLGLKVAVVIYRQKRVKVDGDQTLSGPA